ncbi:MAG TPA: universal stress protein [Chitinophagaceae bacterium]|nr:universal stress protein [Chitinophagaceae bacterium]
MIKFIAAIDGLKYSENTVRYATFLAGKAKAHLVGTFLDDFSYHSYRISELVQDGRTLEKKLREFEKKDAETRNKAEKHFEAECKKANLNFSVHHDKNIAINELLHESIYADLLVVDSEEAFSNYNGKTPTLFIRDMLVEVQCPVVIVPGDYKSIEKIILLYDGGPSSVFAIKMFSYLFPALKQLEVEVISVNPAVESPHIPDNKLMKEFMKRHFPDAEYKAIKGSPEKEIVQYLKKETKHSMIVLGAYRRGMVSRWFKASMADALMRNLKLPLFIAHNK